MQRPKKIGSVFATAEYGGYLEGFLATPKGQTTSSTPTINYCRSLREGLETLTSSTPTNNHCCSLRERLETLILSAPTNNHCRGLRKGLKTQISSAPTNIYCRSRREELETQLVSTISTSFVSGSDIPEDIPSRIELAKTGYVL